MSEEDDPGIAGILARKKRGIDCTEEESVKVLHYFTDNADYLSNPIHADWDHVVRHFPLEWDQWHRDRNND